MSWKQRWNDFVQRWNTFASKLCDFDSTLFQRRAPTLYQRCRTLKIQCRILFHFQRRINVISTLIHNFETTLLQHWNVSWKVIYHLFNLTNYILFQFIFAINTITHSCKKDRFAGKHNVDISVVTSGTDNWLVIAGLYLQLGSLHPNAKSDRTLGWLSADHLNPVVTRWLRHILNFNTFNVEDRFSPS